MEQALVMPLMVFLILGIVQLTMMQQARIMLEYAAFNAARSGAVYNGDPDAMEWAATLSLLPTMGRTDSWGNLMKRAGVAALTAGLGSFLGKFHIPGVATKLVKVEILNPTKDAFSSKYAKHLDYKQLDFDDIRGQAAKDNLLSIRLTYFYHLRVPFVNHLIMLFWFGSTVGQLDRLHSIDFVNPKMAHASDLVAAMAFARGKANLRTAYLAWQAGYDYFPMTTYYTIRMQSNLYKANVLKAAPTGG